MKILIAPDSFKGSVSSMVAAKAMKQAINEVDPTIETILFPMADGGEGTVDAVLWAKGGEKISCRAFDPVGREIDVAYGWIDREKTAVIETAAASGLPLLKDCGLDPENASSYGTGQLIRHALQRGAKKIILGLGGSATVDAGAGLFQALGMKFFDDQQVELKRVGGQLHRIASMDATGVLPALAQIKFIVASDVSNPLLGEDGAVAIFGPQKGITECQLQNFEEGMRSFSEIAVETAGRDMRLEPGSGAAGGIGFLLKMFLETEFHSGLGLIVQIVGLETHLEGADLILTGEGRIDGQSLFGKAPVGIGRIAKKKNIPVIAFAGSIGPGAENLVQAGIDAVVPIADGPMSLEEALSNGEHLLYEATKRMMKLFLLGSSFGQGQKTRGSQLL